MRHCEPHILMLSTSGAQARVRKGVPDAERAQADIWEVRRIV